MNGVCRNFEFNEKENGILELIKLKCDTCDVDRDNCGVYAAYVNAKKYAVSFEFDEKEIKENCR